MENSLKVRLVSMRLGGVAPFEDGATLSFVASKERADRDLLYAIPRFRMSLLPLVAIYGEAASGKSTLVGAFGAIIEMVREASFSPLLSLSARSDVETLSLSMVIAVDDRLYEYVVALQGARVVKEALISARSSSDEVLFLVEGDGPTPVVVPSIVTASHLLRRFDEMRANDIDAIVRALGGAICVDALELLDNREIVVKKSTLVTISDFLEIISDNPSSLLKSIMTGGMDEDERASNDQVEANEGSTTTLSLRELSTSEGALVAISSLLVGQIDDLKSGIVLIDNFDALLDFRITRFLLGKIAEGVKVGGLMSIVLVMKDTVFFDQGFFRRDQLVLTGGSGDNRSITSLAEISELRFDKDIRKMYVNGLFDSL